MLFEKVKELAGKRGKNLKQVAEEIGLSENAFYKWRTQSPKAETLQKVADYFGVTTDYLLGRTNTPTQNQLENFGGAIGDLMNTMNPEQFKAINTFTKLNQENFSLIMPMIEKLVSTQ